jgi:hypothetical protein
VSHRLLIATFVAVLALLLPVTGMSQQTGNANPGTFDPLPTIEKSFPDIKITKRNTLLEFCPDNTCDGFVAKEGTAVSTLKDFAYLYKYFISDYIYLPEWRNQPEAKAMANRVLSKAEYRSCKNDSALEAARCVLLGTSHKGFICLIFVRYDEGARNVVPMDIVKEVEKH